MSTIELAACPACGTPSARMFELGPGARLRHCERCDTVSAPDYVDPTEVYVDGYMMGGAGPVRYRRHRRPRSSDTWSGWPGGGCRCWSAPREPPAARCWTWAVAAANCWPPPAAAGGRCRASSPSAAAPSARASAGWTSSARCCRTRACPNAAMTSSAPFTCWSTSPTAAPSCRCWPAGSGPVGTSSSRCPTGTASSAGGCASAGRRCVRASTSCTSPRGRSGRRSRPAGSFRSRSAPRSTSGRRSSWSRRCGISARPHGRLARVATALSRPPAAGRRWASARADPGRLGAAAARGGGPRRRGHRHRRARRRTGPVARRARRERVADHRAPGRRCAGP